MNRNYKIIILLWLGLLCIYRANAIDPYQPIPYVKIKHPEWAKNATIYELNVRQFSPEGTFRAAENDLKRIHDLNVDIIWLMPIHEIGLKNRKGTLGSPYSVKDYYSVNKEFGTLEDLKHFVNKAHELGLHVIIDWVGNHTSWDNVLVAEHPDWYEKDWKGNFCPTPWWDWSDIIDLDYSKPGLRKYMTEAMKYWVRDVGIDGFRCDAAGFVPVDFWNNARRELDQIKPVFMLAEWEARDLYAQAFDASYAWSWYSAVEEIAKGKSDLNSLFGYYSWNERSFPADSIRMTFATNHDKNSWDGTEYEIFGEAVRTVIALSVVGDGMPLIYNGQEAGNKKRLQFFEKDSIVWKDSPMADFYRKLFALKKANTVLWNGSHGAKMISVVNSVKPYVLSFVRQNQKDKIFAVMNFSKQKQTVNFEPGLFEGNYTEYLSEQKVELKSDSKLSLEPWEFKIYVK